jgi:hypothetical protein
LPAADCRWNRSHRRWLSEKCDPIDGRPKTASLAKKLAAETAFLGKALGLLLRKSGDPIVGKTHEGILPVSEQQFA